VDGLDIVLHQAARSGIHLASSHRVTPDDDDGAVVRGHVRASAPVVLVVALRSHYPEGILTWTRHMPATPRN
jgi:hypothetical protein